MFVWGVGLLGWGRGERTVVGVGTVGAVGVFEVRPLFVHFGGGPWGGT